MGRAAYTFLGPLAALLYFQRPDDARHWRALTLAAAAGVFALVYVSSSVLGLAICQHDVRGSTGRNHHGCGHGRVFGRQ